MRMRDDAPTALVAARQLARDQFRLSDSEVRVLRIACEYARDRAAADQDLPEVWDGMRESYRRTLVSLWAAGRNGGWVEERHAPNLYYGGLLFLTRPDLTRLPFTVEDADRLNEVTRRLGRIVASA